MAYLKDYEASQEFGFLTKAMKKLFDRSYGTKKGRNCPLLLVNISRARFAPSTDLGMVSIFFTATRAVGSTKP
jgi:hypothetical protein